MNEENKGVSRVTDDTPDADSLKNSMNQKKSGVHNRKKPSMSSRGGNVSNDSGKATGSVATGDDGNNVTSGKNESVGNGVDVDSKDVDSNTPDLSSAVSKSNAEDLSSAFEKGMNNMPNGGHRNLFDVMRDAVSNFAHMFAGGVKGLGSTIAQGLIGFGSNVKANMSGMIGTMAKAVGLPPSVVGVLLSTAVVAAGGTGALYLSNAQQMDLILKQDALLPDCEEEVEDTKVISSDMSQDMKEYAYKMWAVGKAIGLTDEQCAGMLGNVTNESAFDSTGIESIYGEDYQIGEKKKAAIADLCKWTRDGMAKSYGNYKSYTDQHGHSVETPGGGSIGLAWSAYIDTFDKNVGSDTHGHFACGIGLFQFTGPEAGHVMWYADSLKKDWWDFDLQMAFVIAPEENGGYTQGTWLTKWATTKTNCSTPEDAAYEFAKEFEGNTAIGIPEKTAAARKWFTDPGIRGSQYKSYAQSILKMAEVTASGGAGKKTADATDDCQDAESSFDNSDAAKAAVAYAWKTRDLAVGNDGTELYRFVHDAVWAGDGIYQSCDRGVSTAIRWSGTDDSFPIGITDDIDDYCSTSPKWEDLGEYGKEVNLEDLQPGDVLNVNGARRNPAIASCGHVVIYVGNDIVKEKYPDSDADFVAASLNTYSPCCQHYDYGSNGNSDTGYHVYRCKEKEQNPQYTTVADSFTGSNGS